MDSLSFTKEAWEQYMEWQMTDRRTAAKINALIKDIQRNGFMNGIGKPEALKTRKAYSRRIDDYHRLVYEADEKQNLRVISCKGHYED
jgi:toxin YoeB